MLGRIVWRLDGQLVEWYLSDSTRFSALRGATSADSIPESIPCRPDMRSDLLRDSGFGRGNSSASRVDNDRTERVDESAYELLS